MRRSPKMVFGFCMSGYHHLCHGTATRPPNTRGEPRPDVLCSCPHHSDPEWEDPRTPRLESDSKIGKRRAIFTYRKEPFP
jgi:hypothetical protein